MSKIDDIFGTPWGDPEYDTYDINDERDDCVLIFKQAEFVKINSLDLDEISTKLGCFVSLIPFPDTTQLVFRISKEDYERVKKL